MRNNSNQNIILEKLYDTKSGPSNILKEDIAFSSNKLNTPQILFISSFPPRECGIATYSQDLINALNNKFNNSFTFQICPIESLNEKHIYKEDIKYRLNTDHPNSFIKLADQINKNDEIKIVLIQYEFGFFSQKVDEFQDFVANLTKPLVIVFHTVLPDPSEVLKLSVQKLANASVSIIVMTQSAFSILSSVYGISKDIISIIPHGTHLVNHSDKATLKEKYNLSGRPILSTFGLLSSGKSIETTIKALSEIIKNIPDVLFLIIGKTHPTVYKNEGEKYRELLSSLITELNLENHVKFINCFLPLAELLEYLQLSDIYLFTSKDPNQAVSGTFSYAISCGCPIISTPIPHAIEVLKKDAGKIIDFENSDELSSAVIDLLKDVNQRNKMTNNGLHRMASTAWENSAISHAMLFDKISNNTLPINYTIPAINLDHIKRLTTDFGIIQFSKINHPDIESGYTLDDNARALIAICQHYEFTQEEGDLKLINIYLNFIKFCFQPEGYFYNYVDKDKQFTQQNFNTNLADANGRAIWSLGYLISLHAILPISMVDSAKLIFQNSLVAASKIHSTRAMAFVIKGIYYSLLSNYSEPDLKLLKELSNRLVQMYRHEKDHGWNWFESYLTYANGLLPEAMLCAWLSTGDLIYKEIANSTFDFLLSKTFHNNKIKIISNKGWLHKGEIEMQSHEGGEQPIDVSYSIIALSTFYQVFSNHSYKEKMEFAFNWFLGKNHLNQVIYNPCTGGCYDGLEENYVNLNQGAESTVSYLIARLTIEKYIRKDAERKSLKHPQLILNKPSYIA